MELEPITRAEQIMSGKSLTPITREEMFLAKAGGQDVQTPTPITRKEMFLQKIAENGGGGSGGGDTGGGDITVVCPTDGTPLVGDIIENLRGLRVEYPNATGYIPSSSFSECDALSAIKCTKIQTIQTQAFNHCRNLTTADFPMVTMLYDRAFSSCESLTTVNFPSLTSIGTSAFIHCTALTSVDLPAATSIGDNAFNGCTALTSVDLPAATSIDNSAFYECTNLHTLILRTADTACNLNVLAIIGTKIATAEGMPTGEGFVYVPSALFEDYVANLTVQATALTGDAATAEYIVRAILRKIEDYPEICG